MGFIISTSWRSGNLFLACSWKPQSFVARCFSPRQGRIESPRLENVSLSCTRSHEESSMSSVIVSYLFSKTLTLSLSGALRAPFHLTLLKKKLVHPIPFAFGRSSVTFPWLTRRFVIERNTSLNSFTGCAICKPAIVIVNSACIIFCIFKLSSPIRDWSNHISSGMLSTLTDVLCWMSICFTDVPCYLNNDA